MNNQASLNPHETVESIEDSVKASHDLSNENINENAGIQNINSRTALTVQRPASQETTKLKGRVIASLNTTAEKESINKSQIIKKELAPEEVQPEEEKEEIQEEEIKIRIESIAFEASNPEISEKSSIRKVYGFESPHHFMTPSSNKFEEDVSPQQSVSLNQGSRRNIKIYLSPSPVQSERKFSRNLHSQEDEKENYFINNSEDYRRSDNGLNDSNEERITSKKMSSVLDALEPPPQRRLAIQREIIAQSMDGNIFNSPQISPRRKDPPQNIPEDEEDNLPAQRQIAKPNLEQKYPKVSLGLRFATLTLISILCFYSAA